MADDRESRRAKTAGDHRDVRQDHRPPPGVLKQIAPAKPETWESPRSSTNVFAKPMSGGETVIEQIARRTGETKNQVGTMADVIKRLEQELTEQKLQNDAIMRMLGEQNRVRDEMLARRDAEDQQRREFSQMLRLKEVELEQEKARNAMLGANTERTVMLQEKQADAILRRTIVKSVALKVIAWGVAFGAAAISGGYIFSACRKPDAFERPVNPPPATTEKYQR